MTTNTAPKRKPGRPPTPGGTPMPTQFNYRASRDDLAILDELSGLWAVHRSEAIRRAVKEALEREAAAVDVAPVASTVVAPVAGPLDLACDQCDATRAIVGDVREGRQAATSAGWEIDFPAGKQRARCPQHSAKAYTARALAKRDNEGKV